MKTVFITGVGGFVGSNLADRLLESGLHVVGWDNFSTGQRRFLAGAEAHPRFRLLEGDCTDQSALIRGMQGCDFVFHLAANADIRDGWSHPEKDLQQNTISTFRVLEAMRRNGVRRIAFSSTGSVYGEPNVSAERPTPETASFPIQTSLYGASKAACEGLISAYAEGGQLDEAMIFRFVSILGERYTHGHVFDFYKQLVAHPERLNVLGDGRQRKSYLYVQDCIEAMLHVVRQEPARHAQHRTSIFNLGTTEFLEVNQSIGILCKAMGVVPRIEYSGGERGWIGDSPFIFLDTTKIRATGWKPLLSIEAGLIRTLRWLEANQWVYEERNSM